MDPSSEKFDISQNYNRRPSGACRRSSDVPTRRRSNDSDSVRRRGSRYSVRRASTDFDSCSDDVKEEEEEIIRESHTADLEKFDFHVRRLKNTERAFVDRPFDAAFWEHIRGMLAQATGFGYGGSEDGNAVDPKGPEDSAAFLGKIRATCMIHPMQPLLLAEHSGIPISNVLTELFYATRIGLVKILFAPDCRRCGTLVCTQEKLSGLPRKAACAGCHASNEIRSLDKLKVVFRFNDEVLWTISENFPCQPSLASMAENIIFAIVPSTPTGSGVRYAAGCGPEDQQLRPIIPAGKYRVHCPVACTDAFLVVERDATDDDEPVTLTFDVSDLVVDTTKPCDRDELLTMTVPHGKMYFNVFNNAGNYFFALWIQNDVDDDIIYNLPQEERSPYTSATDVLHHPLLSHFFSDQVVRRANKFEIEHVVLVFTDVVGSTDMYASLGDGDALDLVTHHFEILFAAFAENGRVVKTIGDAVMGSFTSGRAAIEAVARAMKSLREECIRPDGTALEIRVGIHAGPAIVVPVNGMNDYFGQTVNMAARVESKASASQVYVSDTLLSSDPDAKVAFEEVLASEDGYKEVMPQTLSLKGIKECVQTRGFTYVKDGDCPAPHLPTCKRDIMQRRQSRRSSLVRLPRSIHLLVPHCFEEE